MTKRAFTLVELLVVVGIMAAMATMSIGSYFAVVRGMADRGALAAATSIISLAQERARIDLSPTVVYFYNEIVQNKDESKGDELVVAGVAIAVRRGGRITHKTGSRISDEFADLDRTYGVKDGAAPLCGDSFRLYRFNFIKMEYSSVYTEVVEEPVGNETYLVEQPVDRGFKFDNGEKEDPTEIMAYAFEVLDGNASWKPGDAYGYEFARIRLPDNYIFGSESDVPSKSNPIKDVSPVIKCLPDSNANSLESIQVSARRPSGWKKIGESKDEMKDI
jgi:prepilin-type N-terminal cleavage/methylation domain-containing protein